MSSNTENSALPDDTQTGSLAPADRYREDPRPVRMIKHTRIALSDGVELAARIWLPENLDDEAVPAVLEYIPYRKNDTEVNSCVYPNRTQIPDLMDLLFQNVEGWPRCR